MARVRLSGSCAFVIVTRRCRSATPLLSDRTASDAASFSAHILPSWLDDPVDRALIHRVLVIKLRHHGDVLLTSPVFSVLQRALPGVECDALVYAETAPMLEDHPSIAQVHTIDRGWKRSGLLRQLRSESRLLSSAQRITATHVRQLRWSRSGGGRSW